MEYVNGDFQLWSKDGKKMLTSIPVSGNARQRRLYVRRWKRMGYVVRQYCAYTRTFTYK